MRKWFATAMRLMTSSIPARAQATSYRFDYIGIRRGIVSIFVLSLTLAASDASATYLTFENVWGSSINFVNLGFWDVSHTIELGELWSSDYGIQPPFAFPLDITKANPLLPGRTYMTPLIPWLPDSGFLFTGLGVAGDFGFTNVSDVSAGHTVIIPGSSVIYALWPTGGPGVDCQTCGTLQIIRITFHPGAPPFSFRGFFSPVDNDPIINSVKAGAGVPVKFSLGGYQGLNIFQGGFPASQSVACDSVAQLAPVEETVSAGQSGLTYDALIDQYTYVWKTDKRWASTCRQLVLRLTDGSFHIADFQFGK